jgi:hypothetical protein
MTVTTVISQPQFLNQDAIAHLIENGFEVSANILNDIEIDLESILSAELERGLTNDLDNPF